MYTVPVHVREHVSWLFTCIYLAGELRSDGGDSSNC